MPKRARCTTFANHKDGTGKTTSRVSIAGFLTKSGHKTLVIDVDPQTNATSALGIDATTLKHSMYDAILKECGHKRAPLQAIRFETGIDNLHLAPAEFDLSAAELLLLANPFALSRILDEVRPDYDDILHQKKDAPYPTGAEVCCRHRLSKDRSIYYRAKRERTRRTVLIACECAPNDNRCPRRDAPTESKSETGGRKWQR